MSIPLAIATVVGIFLLFIGAYSRVLFPNWSADSGILIFCVALFVTIPSWGYFLKLGTHYYVTNQRVVIARSNRVRELGFDNIENV